MTTIGYHASHEQFTPADLLRFTIEAEAAGFGAAMCSDHFAPWSEIQGQSGYAWSWLGSALQATSLSLGAVNAPGYRYHPAIIAQAIATLEQMYPGRFWVALATGQAMNERMTGLQWPAKAERSARLLECVKVIRDLLAGDTVTHNGRVTLEGARLWSRPDHSPPLFGAALSPETAAMCGTWADGLITVAPAPHLEEIIKAFRLHGGADKPVYLQVHLSWADIDATARTHALDHWGAASLPAAVGQELRSTEQFAAAASLVRIEDVEQSVHIGSDLRMHCTWLRQYIDMGIERLYLHNVGPDQTRFIESFGKSVLPKLR